MAKVDLKGVRRIHAAELLERHRKRVGEEAKQKKKRKKNRTIVSSVSIPPELKIRVARDLGEGSFSRGVVRACSKALLEFDQAAQLAREALGDK